MIPPVRKRPVVFLYPFLNCAGAMEKTRGKEPGVIFMSGMTLNYQKGENK